MVVYPAFAWKHNEGPPFCTRNMICLSRCSKSCASHLSPYPSSLAQSQRKDQFLPLLMITKPSCISCLFFKQTLLCVLSMLALRLQSNPPEMSTTLSPYFLVLGFAAVSTEPWGRLRLLRCFGFECWTSCVVFFSSSFIDLKKKKIICYSDPDLVLVGSLVVRIMHKNSCLYLAQHLNEWCDVQARSSLLLICLLYVPQKPLVLLHWSAALEGQWTSRRMTTRRSYATTSTALTAPGCTFSASTSGRAAFWSSSIASAEQGAGTKSSVAKTCGQRRDTTSLSASAPVGAGRVIWRKTLTGTRWNECRMTRRKSLCWRRAREGLWRSQQKRPKRAGQPTSRRKA